MELDQTMSATIQPAISNPRLSKPAAIQAGGYPSRRLSKPPISKRFRRRIASVGPRASRFTPSVGDDEHRRRRPTGVDGYRPLVTGTAATKNAGVGPPARGYRPRVAG